MHRDALLRISFCLELLSFWPISLRMVQYTALSYEFLPTVPSCSDRSKKKEWNLYGTHRNASFLFSSYFAFLECLA